MIRACIILSALLTLASTAGAGALPDTVRVASSGNGTRYHSIRCASVVGGGVLVWRASADSLGLVACKRCLLVRSSKARRLPRIVGAR